MAHWRGFERGSSRVGVRPSRRLAALGRALAAVLLALAVGLMGAGCCLVRPPHAQELLAAADGGFRTPERTFRTFQTAFAADLPGLEYRCFSEDFVARNRISELTYREARAQMLHSKPWLVYFAKARVEKSEPAGEGRHRVWAEVAGTHCRVDLVREDRFYIWAGDVLLADGVMDFAAAARVRSGQGGVKVLAAQVAVDPEEYPDVDLSGATEVSLERRWKIDDLVQVEAPKP